MPRLLFFFFSGPSLASGVIVGSAIGATILVMIALLLIIFSIAVCVARWKSKRSLLYQSNISIRNEQQLALVSTEVSYEYVRTGSLCRDTDNNIITEQNLAYEPTRIETSSNVAYRNKTAVHYHNPLTESLLQSDSEYAYIISQPI